MFGVKDINASLILKQKGGLGSFFIKPQAKSNFIEGSNTTFYTRVSPELNMYAKIVTAVSSFYQDKDVVLVDNIFMNNYLFRG